MKKHIIFLFFVLINLSLWAQKEKPTGDFQVGVRSTISAFNDHEDETMGRGIGGQFRIRLSDRINTEWFFDYLNSSLGDYATRTDYHIGWSVLYYPLNTSYDGLVPFVLAGHCFDYTHIRGNRPFDMSATRWSSAVQGGLGTHFYITPYFDISLVAQYMMHLGKHLHGHLKPNGAFHIHEENSNALEGHLLINLSFNFKLWKNK